MNEIKTVEDKNSRVDFFEESFGNKLVIVFVKSPSKNFSFALSIAELSEKFMIADFNKNKLYTAVFTMSKSCIEKAKVLLVYNSTVYRVDEDIRVFSEFK